jgi:predicted MFS family arabinose efflux permease
MAGSLGQAARRGSRWHDRGGRGPTALTAADRMPPALPLMFTFVLGTGAILVAPVYQSLVPDMVPRQLVPAAWALGSISINLARAIGPAIAGLLVARIGVAAVFGYGHCCR